MALDVFLQKLMHARMYVHTYVCELVYAYVCELVPVCYVSVCI